MKKYQKTDCFKSFLSSPIREYLQIKTALNYHIDSIGYALAQFDQYLCIHRISTFEKLTSSFFLDWIDEEASQTSPITVVDKICILKGFFDHLVRVELIGQNPTESIPTIKLFQYIPYVFSRDQIKKILDVANRQVTESRNYFFARRAHYAIFYTIYACGLRISECLKIKGKDLRWDDMTLFIRETKFGKSRIIPFHGKLAQVLADYRCVREKRFGMLSSTNWFFVTYKNSRYHRNSIWARFQDLLKKAGITEERKFTGNVIYGGPTVHSLRHSFAVHRLMRWYEEGVNPNDKLHLLATYMGHYNYEYTHHYLRLCTPLRKLANDAFAKGFDTLSWIRAKEDEQSGD